MIEFVQCHLPSPRSRYKTQETSPEELDLEDDVQNQSPTRRGYANRTLELKLETIEGCVLMQFSGLKMFLECTVYMFLDTLGFVPLVVKNFDKALLQLTIARSAVHAQTFIWTPLDCRAADI